MYFSKNLTRRSVGLLVRKYASFVVLLMMLLFAGCEEEPEPEIVNTGFIPVGEWTDGYGGSYTITSTSVVHDDGFGYGDFISTILEANNFSSDSGVLIIKITASNVGYTVDKFTCVYYKDYTASHIFLANPIDESYAPIENDTLAEAKATFNFDNVGTHVGNWGSGYSK
ncbi:hypothetical protein [Treponema sp. R80B11-R83G3]